MKQAKRHSEILASIGHLSVEEKIALMHEVFSQIESELSREKGSKSQSSLPRDPATLPHFQDSDIDAALRYRDDQVHRNRLSDASDEFHKLLKKYGYKDLGPTVRDHTRQALGQLEEQRRARPRPAWADWVAKEDEEAPESRKIADTEDS